MKILKGLFVLMICLFALPINAQNKEKVAVFDPEGGVPKGTIEIIRDIMVDVLVNSRIYDVLERAQMNKILEEHKFQQSGLVDDSQISEIGQKLGAKYVLVANIRVMENDANFISFKMVNVNTAKIHMSGTVRPKSSSDDYLDLLERIIKEKLGVNTDAIAQHKQETPKQESTNEAALINLMGQMMAKQQEPAKPQAPVRQKDSVLRFKANTCENDFNVIIDNQTAGYVSAEQNVDIPWYSGYVNVVLQPTYGGQILPNSLRTSVNLTAGKATMIDVSSSNSKARGFEIDGTKTGLPIR